MRQEMKRVAAELADAGRGGSDRRLAFGDAPGSPVHAVLDRLGGVRRAGRGWVACCPAHDDRSPSLAIGLGDNDTVLLHCFAGCAAVDVVSSIGLTLSDLFTRPMARAAVRHVRGAVPFETLSRAAFQTVLKESTVIQIAAADLVRSGCLSEDDQRRLIEAADRIHHAWEVLRGRRHA